MPQKKKKNGKERERERMSYAELKMPILLTKLELVVCVEENDCLANTHTHTQYSKWHTEQQKIKEKFSYKTMSNRA